MADANLPPDDPRLDHELYSLVQAALVAQAKADRESAGPLDIINPSWAEQQRARMRAVRQKVIADYQARRMMAPPFRRGEG